MYDLDTLTAWLTEQYIPWYEAQAAHAAKGPHTDDVGDEGPPPKPPVQS